MAINYFLGPSVKHIGHYILCFDDLLESIYGILNAAIDRRMFPVGSGF